MCGALFILAGIGMGVYCLWAGIHSLVRGVVVNTGRYHSTTYARATAPPEYWLTEIVLLVLGIILVPIFVGALFQRLRLSRSAKTALRDALDTPKPP